jgi:hypothetical protein
MWSSGVALSHLAQHATAAATVEPVEQQSAAATTAAGPAVDVFSLVLQVRAAYVLADFDEPVRLRFRRSFAALACFCAGGCCLKESQVTLSAQEDSGGRRRAGGGLLVNVTLTGAPSAVAAAAVVGDLTGTRINSALQAEGLDPVTVTLLPAVVRAAGSDNNALGTVIASSVPSSARFPVPTATATVVAFANVQAKSFGHRAHVACYFSRGLQVAMFFLFAAVIFPEPKII